MKPLCSKCITEPEKFSSMIMPLTDCYKHKFHVHKNGDDYVVYKDTKYWLKDIQKQLLFEDKESV